MVGPHGTKKQPLLTLMPVSHAMPLEAFKTALLKKRCARGTARRSYAQPAEQKP